MVARLRLDAHRCGPAPARLPRQTGRPRVVGARLPNLTTYANDPATPWTTCTAARWYGERDRPIQLLTFRVGLVQLPAHYSQLLLAADAPGNARHGGSVSWECCIMVGVYSMLSSEHPPWVNDHLGNDSKQRPPQYRDSRLPFRGKG